MEYCILSQCWFVLYYFLRPLGIYPCKRTGSAGLEPTSATNFWSRLIFTIFIIGLINGATYSYIYLEESSAQSISFEILLTAMTITDIFGIAALGILFDEISTFKYLVFTNRHCWWLSDPLIKVPTSIIFILARYRNISSHA